MTMTLGVPDELALDRRQEVRDVERVTVSAMEAFW